MNCPNCQQPLTVDHLRDEPACMEAANSIIAAHEPPAEIKTLRSLRNSALRREWPPPGYVRAGRPKVARKCAKCGAWCEGTVEAREHCKEKSA